ncbi:MAG: LytTR family DNA-binding domain-containing protein [Bacteroidota bacterium]
MNENTSVANTNKQTNKSILHDIDKILYCEADGSYTRIIMSSGKSELLAKRLCNIEDYFKHNKFFRCHRSYLVNIDQIKEIKLNRQMCLIMYNDHEIQVSCRKKTMFFNYIKKYYLIFDYKS